MAHSNYLAALSAEEYRHLKSDLHEAQNGRCYICGREIDMDVEETDVDHIEPLASGGKDSPSNFALTHSGCNKRKQDSDLRVAQVLETGRPSPCYPPKTPKSLKIGSVCFNPSPKATTKVSPSTLILGSALLPPK